MRITEIAQDPNIWPTTLRVGKYLDQNTAEFEKADDYLDAGQLITAVEDLIAAGVEPQVVTVNPAQLMATQDWLSNYGSRLDLPGYSSRRRRIILQIYFCDFV
jgi:hypothetical protein